MPAVPSESLGSRPGSVITGRDWEVCGATHNWPSVVRVREGLTAKHTLVKLTILPILDFGDVIYKIASNLAIWMQSITVPSVLSPKPTHHCDLYALVGWPRLISAHWSP